ncbi:MAG TPA: TMEM165/GDT1 family protein [Rhodocyclaceae bacterium]|nr:TMEM165/GDT1 family protein [Rhodocyclaceae bacterium]
MQAFLVSTGVVALAEIGDKTQLLSLVLAARFRKPWPITFGILVSTLINHAGAAAIGKGITNWLSPNTLRWILGVSFLVMAVWTMIPDKLDENRPLDTTHFGIFGTTVVAFFLAEMGDKTQFATIALAAKYGALSAVVAGTTLGMMLANVPVVFIGDKLTRKIPIRAIHFIAATIFALFGILALVSIGSLA